MAHAIDKQIQARLKATPVARPQHNHRDRHWVLRRCSNEASQMAFD